MTAIRITKTRLRSGVWEGLMDGADGQPDIAVTFLGRGIEGVELAGTDVEGRFSIRIPLPQEMLSDGVHTALITASETDETLEVITVIAGDALNEDIRSEVHLLRAELDMLKSAFRRHCVETM